jgi:hypothetical protein
MPALEDHTERDPNEVHAEAFRDLEGEVSELDRMGESRETATSSACSIQIARIIIGESGS